MIYLLGNRNANGNHKTQPPNYLTRNNQIEINHNKHILNLPYSVLTGFTLLRNAIFGGACFGDKSKNTYKNIVQRNNTVFVCFFIEMQNIQLKKAATKIYKSPSSPLAVDLWVSLCAFLYTRPENPTIPYRTQCIALSTITISFSKL